MSACETQTFNNINEAAWNRLLQRAGDFGVTIAGHNGESSRDGFTIRWDYDPTAHVLQLQCTDSPWWAPCAMINEKMQDLVEAAL